MPWQSIHGSRETKTRLDDALVLSLEADIRAAAGGRAAQIQNDKIMKLYEQVLKIYQEEVGEKCEEIGVTLLKIARFVNDIDMALMLMDAVIPIFREKKSTHPLYFEALNLRCGMYNAIGLSELAGPDLEEVGCGGGGGGDDDDDDDDDNLCVNDDNDDG
jgi:hypothetical protein